MRAAHSDMSRLAAPRYDAWAILFCESFGKSAYPSEILYSNVDTKGLIEFIRKKNPKKSDVWMFETAKGAGATTVKEFAYKMDNEILIAVNEFGQTSLYYSDQTPYPALQGAKKLITAHVKKDKTGNIGLIGKNANGSMVMKTFSLKETDMNIDGVYNDDFAEFDKRVSAWVNSDKKGIVIMHGLAGTGKSSYIRHLSHKTTKTIIYIPPDMTSVIAQPDFVTFITQYPKSILLIEDAENVIKTRSAYSNQAVSNLLNLSDGLLSDCMQLQIICTFNSDIANVDPALLRPGRLEAKYEFGKLSEDKVRKLVKKYNLPFVPKAATIAEVFNDNTLIVGGDRKAVGFKFDKPSLNTTDGGE